MDIKRQIVVPEKSKMTVVQYKKFLTDAFCVLKGMSNYFAPDEDINSLELAHLMPEVDETVIAIYLGINDATCNKGLVSPFLVRHGHNNVFVFDPQLYSGGKDVPSGTVDAKLILNGFEPPNRSWQSSWTYVMIQDPARSFESLWREKGYIDMILAKFEDFTVMSDLRDSKICIFIDPAAFEHPVNKARPYLKSARDRGQKMACEFAIPSKLAGETDGLEPVVPDKGEKLYVARTDFAPCAHCWSNLHSDNKTYAAVNENSAVPLDLVVAKPPVSKKFAKGLIPPKGSADMTTDWFYRGTEIVRMPLLEGLFKG